MRREALAAIIVGVAALGLVVFSIAKNNALTVDERSADSLIAIDPREDVGTGLGGAAQRDPEPAPPRATGFGRVSIPSGTGVPVRVETRISSEHASVGDSWSGYVTDDVYARGRLVVPSGSRVSGTVAAARPAERGHRAMIQLALSRLHIGGQSYRVRGGSEAVIAGSTRARNLGGIAAGTAAGALIGKAVSGSGKGAVIGGVVGGAASGAAVAKSKGYQAVIREGASMTFTLRSPVSVSRRAIELAS
jgi:hypothetical protein